MTTLFSHALTTAGNKQQKSAIQIHCCHPKIRTKRKNITNQRTRNQHSVSVWIFTVNTRRDFYFFSEKKVLRQKYCTLQSRARWSVYHLSHRLKESGVRDGQLAVICSERRQSDSSICRKTERITPPASVLEASKYNTDIQRGGWTQAAGLGLRSDQRHQSEAITDSKLRRRRLQYCRVVGIYTGRHHNSINSF